MIIQLLKTNDVNEKLNKTFEVLASLTGTARNEDEVGKRNINLRILVDNVSIIEKCNYLYCEELSRYYFVRETKSLVNNIWTVECEVDVLMSYKDEILQCSGIIERSSSMQDYYLSDGADMYYQNPHIVYKKFSSGFDPNNTSTLLMTI